MMIPRMLLKSWAIPPARVPMASSFWACRRRPSRLARSSSARLRSVISIPMHTMQRFLSTVIGSADHSRVTCRPARSGICNSTPCNLPVSCNCCMSAIRWLSDRKRPSSTELWPMAPGREYPVIAENASLTSMKHPVSSSEMLMGAGLA